jgi:hypothetical protein
MAIKKIGYMFKQCGPFPLTPALSPGERAAQKHSRFAPLNRPLSGLRHPLPLRGGEGKGEGAVSIASRFRGRAR